MITKNVNTFVDTLEMDTNARENLRYKLEDIVIRGVKDHLVDSYCKSLGWSDDVSQAWVAFREWENTTKAEEVSSDLDVDKATSTARALLTRLLEDTVGFANNNTSLEGMYSAIVAGYHEQQIKLAALEAELENIDDKGSEDAVSLAVNNLMVGFLRKAGYADSDISEMSLAEMSSRIENSMAVVNAITAVAMDKEGVY